MRSFSLGVLLLVAASSQAQNHMPTFAPKPGGLVVVYRHQFKKDKWAEARQTFQERFFKQISHDRKDIRDSFILESPEHGEILGITLWRSEKDLKDWESQPERQKHQKELDSFRSRPFEAKRFRILDIGSELRIRAHHLPMFVPAPGQVVVVHVHRFMKSKWAEARRLFERRFSSQNLHEHTDVRHSLILERPEEGELMTVTLWKSEQDWEAWQRLEAHAKHQRDMLPFKETASETKIFRMLDEIIEVSHAPVNLP
jgi:heme-degrading monooxygenase HmoA